MNEKRNIILLTIDSLRADHLGCLGYFKDISPNIDKFAGEGLLFSQCISNGGMTMISFPSIIASSYTGVHRRTQMSFRTTRTRWSVAERELGTLPSWGFLSSDRMTIAEVLKKNGYSTAAFNARNPWISSFFHYDRGFDVFDDQLFRWMLFDWMLAKNASSIKIKCNKILRRLDRSMRVGKAILGMGSNSANAINDKAISWLTKNKDIFFLWLHYMDVHMPYNPGTFIRRIKARRLNKKRKSKKSLSRSELQMFVNFYDDAIKYVDHEIGCLLSELERVGISFDNTYFFLTADHGEQFMEHEATGHGRLYDEVLRVPLIICGPGIKKNAVIKDQVSLLDLSPTIVDLLHIPRLNSFQGRSLLPLMNGKDSAERGVFSEAADRLYPSQFSFRTEEWKYILTLDERSNQIKAELYDLHRDPGEKENLIEVEKTRAEEFRLRILNHIAAEEREKTNEAGEPDIYSIEDKRKIEERLKDLGYI